MMPEPHTGRYAIPTRTNAAIIVCQFAALVGCFYGAAHVHRWWSLAMLAFAFAILMNSVYSVIHEAEHAMLFPSRAWNDLAGVVMTLFFPAPFHLIRQGHLGHHQRNRSDDEAFDLYFEDDHPIWRWVVLYGILTGCYWIVVVLSSLVFLVAPFAIDKKYWEFDRPSMALIESLNSRYRRLIQLEAVSVLLLHTLIIWEFGIHPVNYAIMYFGFGLTWSSMQYVHHYGTERHVTRGARNLWIFGPLDAIWLNHNWHRTHHEHPTVPWNNLPRLSADLSLQLERGFLPWAYLRMWRGPRLASDHVENKFAGQMIR
jgi:fatty acid desaturase